MNKKQIIKHIKETCRENNFLPTRQQQWQIFCDVCDGQYDAGHITRSQHKRWTTLF